ncbi:MAG: sigma-70 family RNA polymerase sigma factor [Gammaproteobacteria bacterium]
MITEYRQAIATHRQRIYSFAQYSLRAPADADDVTQEVFIKLWQHWQKIDHDRLGAWLMRVAHNAVIDHVRKQRTVQGHVDEYSDVQEQADDVDAGKELDQASIRENLQCAIQALDDPFRSILIMRDVQGLSYQDIQETLEISESQVKVYLHRGRRKLRENTALKQVFSSYLGLESKRDSATAKDSRARSD